MRHFTLSFPLAGLAVGLAVALVVLSACELDSTSPQVGSSLQTAQGAASNMMNSSAPFPTWRQDFEHGTAGWEQAGATGWCGSVEPVEARRGGSAEGTVAPSTGRSYAAVRHGGCEAPWDTFFPDGSGPASSAMPQGETFPAAGYVMELDIHLDPAWEDGTAFGYSASFRVLDQDWPAHFRYYLHDVVVDGGVLTVDGHPIDEAGWYTFRHRFESDDQGMLAVQFEVLKKGREVFSEALPVVLEFADEVHVHDTDDFPVSNVSSAYLWFSYLTPELELPIDRQVMRPRM